jgi:tetratricopeptide (TPR) repeat protein
MALHEIQVRLLKANESYWARQVEIQELGVAAWAAFAAGNRQAALQQMETAAALEDGTEKSVVTPGPLAPARESLAEMLLQLNDPAHALEQFEATLRKEPWRFRSLYGAAHAAQLIGGRNTSQRYFRELLKVCADTDKPGRIELKEARDALANRKS